MHMAAILYINLKVKTDQEKKLQRHFGKTFSRCFNVNVNVTPKTCLEITTSFILDKKL